MYQKFILTVDTDVKGRRLMNKFSYLEFGSVDPVSGSRQVYDFRTHEKAYEWLMGARYANDIVAYNKMTVALSRRQLESVEHIFVDEIHHKDDLVFNCNKLIALELCQGSFFELGQTLFGCIDGMHFLTELNALILARQKRIDLTAVRWIGVDISEYFNILARMLHSSHDVSVFEDVNELPSHLNVFFAKGITLLYAIRAADQLFGLMSKSDISIIDYSFSVSSSIDTQVGTGKDIRYLSQPEFLIFYKKIQADGKDIWVRDTAGIKPNSDLFYFEGIVCNADIAFMFIEKQLTWRNKLKSAFPQLFNVFIHDKSERYWRWSRLSDILSKNNIG
ncbi:hypothetical protein [Aeromonas salmonicida]|uniref:hypothetical protein n=1 Tax=Aeromonas salmonicida TaxID=645 RepID=UPI003D1D8B3F